MAILAVPQCASQRRNLDFEVASFDKGIRPYEVPQFILADQSTGPLDQCDQDVERSAAEAKWPVSFQKKALAGKDVEAPERYRCCLGHDRLISGSCLLRRGPRTCHNIAR
jgi:hypothetical protein